MATITESVRIEGNGAKLIGNPTYITPQELKVDKDPVIGSPYKPAIVSEDVITIPAFSFARIGNSGSDNSGIEVDISDLGADGLASVAELRTGATLSVTGGEFSNLVNYTDSDAAGRAVFEARADSTLNLSEVSISRHYPFDNVVDLPDAPAAVFFGSIIGEDARLNMQGSSISGSYGAGAIAWNGGEANIVSSVLEDAGGISISDRGDETRRAEFRQQHPVHDRWR